MSKKLSSFLIFLASASAIFLPLAFSHQPSDLQLRVEPAAFSPNGDDLQDQTFFYPIVESAADVSRWRIDIRRVGGKLIRRLTGSELPSLVPWDGNDAKGNPALEGPY